MVAEQVYDGPWSHAVGLKGRNLTPLIAREMKLYTQATRQAAVYPDAV